MPEKAHHVGAAMDAQLVENVVDGILDGRDFDAESDEAMRLAVTGQIDEQSAALYLSGRLYDDGVIDPRDTRTVLGICLSAIHSGPVIGTGNFGVFRL